MARRRASQHRRDGNHQLIRQALEARGWLVNDTSQVGGGYPDLTIVKGARVEFVEIKDGSKPPSARKLSAAEVDAAWRFAVAGKQILIISTVEQAVNL